jgi:hypothetical protein
VGEEGEEVDGETAERDGLGEKERKEAVHTYLGKKQDFGIRTYVGPAPGRPRFGQYN